MRYKFSAATGFILSFVLLATPFCSQKKNEKEEPVWKGTVETVDGVAVVKNPLEPMFGDEAFVLEEEMTIGETKGSEEYMFQNLRSIAVSETGDIFTLDYGARNVKVFDKDGRYLRTIGREGQGPGEFNLPMALVCLPGNEIVVGDFNRISYFSKEGNYSGGTPLSSGSLMNIDIDTGGNIFGYSIDREKMVYALKKYDPELNELHLFGTSPLPTVEYSKTGKLNAFFSILVWDIINGDQVVTGYSEEGYIFKIFDSSGNQLRRIEKESVPVEIAQKDFELFVENVPPSLKDSYYAPRYYPPYSALRADDEGRIWVLTPEAAPDEGKRMWDVFDAGGRYILKVALKSSPRIFGNKMFCIEEDEDGFHCIKRYNINWGVGK